MNLTLLIDLDNTLLGNDMDVFLPTYFKALGDHLKSFVPPDALISSLLASTQTMMSNENPSITLKESFDADFYPQLNVPQTDIQPAIHQFYDQVYPELKSVTAQKPEAVALVETALERRWQIAIATNPLFPQTAVHQRLDWAGLPVDKYPYTVVSAYEHFHFAKPNPAYFAEVLAQSGWPDGPTIMVGNDWDADIAPAHQLGLATFHVGNTGYTKECGCPHSSGRLDQIVPWVDQLNPDDLIPGYDTPTAISAILRATPAALQSTLSDVPLSNWTSNPLPGEWNFTQIICHLRDVDKEVHLPRLETFRDMENPRIEAIEADSWAAERNYSEQNGPQALEEFIEARIALIELVASLTQEQWNQPAKHTILGPTTLKELLKINARHDRLHIQQLFKLLEAIDNP